MPEGLSSLDYICDIEAIGKALERGLRFRYLFSRTYREKTRQRWKNKSKISIAFEVFEATMGVAFIIIILFAIFGVTQSYEEKYRA